MDGLTLAGSDHHDTLSTVMSESAKARPRAPGGGPGEGTIAPRRLAHEAPAGLPALRPGKASRPPISPRCAQLNHAPLRNGIQAPTATPSDHAALCVLQSRPHETWARFLGSSMKDDLRYTPSDCFETFPFPRGWETDPALEDAGQAYYALRASLMVRNGEGLTKTYNRFHDPYENDPEIARLRELHATMDRAVLAAYGWADLPIDCEFLLDYETGAEETGSSRKKPYRCRWPDEIREEILARLLELNVQRAAEEVYDGRGDRATASNRWPV